MYDKLMSAAASTTYLTGRAEAAQLVQPTRQIQDIAEQIHMMNDMAFRLWSNMSGEIDRISGAIPQADSTAAPACEALSELDGLRQSVQRLHSQIVACIDTAGRLASI